MEIQILDVDYMLVDEKPILRIFGKTLEGESVCGFYEGYQPYFYILGESGLDILKNEPQVLKVERVERKIVWNSGTVYKVTTRNPAKTPDLRELLKSKGVKVFEADILFRYRFMSDMGLGGIGWVNFKSMSPIETATVRTDRKIRVMELEKSDTYANAPLKILAIDIECVSDVTPLPDPKKDPIILVSLAFNSQFKGVENMVLSTRAGDGVVAFDCEKEMLEKLIEIIKEYDADVITGYNINNFDTPYILERMRRLRIRPVFGRCEQKPVMDKKIGIRYKNSIVGRVFVDSFQIIKKDYSLTRYGLDFVAEALLKEKKGDIKKSDIGKLWKGDQKGFDKLVYYSRQDAILALNLLLKLDLLNKYKALSRAAGTLLQDTLDGGETGRIENFLLREFNREGYVFPCKPDPSEIAERESRSKTELKGGFVLEPKKGLHSNIVVCDFKSMYPSIIRTFNICPTTLVKDLSKYNLADLTKTPADVYFIKKEVRPGIIPRILEELMNKRQEAKKKEKAAKDKQLKSLFYAEQWALKILANAFYGYLGYAKARLYDLGIANSITGFGREMIHGTVKSMEDFGYEIVYGDTDSVMVDMREDDMEKIRAKAAEAAKKISEGLPGVMELQFEKVFKRFLPLSKKRYAAWKFEPTKEGWDESIEMKGIETVRRDWCPLVSETLRTVIDIILKENDPKKATVYFKGIIDNLVKGKIDVNKLVITKTITRSPENYAGVQPHIELAKKIAKRGGEVPGVGDRIGYVIIRGMDLISKRTEDPTYVAEKGLEIDPKYYIENQLLPPLERIFTAMGISKPELFGGGKQTGLLDILRSQQQAKKEIIAEIPQSEFTGFICKVCSKFYQRPLLSGVCECGSQLAFSSKLGAAECLVVGQ